MIDRLARLGVLLGPLAAFGVALFAVELPWFSFGPGDPREVVPRIEMDAPRTYQPDGKLLLTTVNVGRVNAFELFDAWLDPAKELAHETDVLSPGETDRERERRSRTDMDESVVAAVAYALSRTSDYPAEHGEGALVHSVVAGTPAERVLVPGDVILEVDDEPVEEVDDFGDAVRAAGTGRDLELRVRVDRGKMRTFNVRPVRSSGRAVVGVVLVESFPFDVSVRTGDVGGPSAGLMWALGALDLLTPGELTGGRTVAGTGTVDLSGGVGPIGGVEHKVAAAEEAGAEIFLLPRDNLDEARRVEPRLRLVPVDSVDQAVAFLEGGAA